LPPPDADLKVPLPSFGSLRDIDFRSIGFDFSGGGGGADAPSSAAADGEEEEGGGPGGQCVDWCCCSCEWTADYACPQTPGHPRPPGRLGYADDDGGACFGYCCDRPNDHAADIPTGRAGPGGLEHVIGLG